jgi:hypothetical protein
MGKKSQETQWKLPIFFNEMLSCVTRRVACVSYLMFADNLPGNDLASSVQDHRECLA